MLLRGKIWCASSRRQFTASSRVHGHGLTLFSKIVIEASFHMCYSNHVIFIRSGSSGSVVLAVYVSDILLIGSDVNGIDY